MMSKASRVNFNKIKPPCLFYFIKSVHCVRLQVSSLLLILICFSCESKGSKTLTFQEAKENEEWSASEYLLTLDITPLIPKSLELNQPLGVEIIAHESKLLIESLWLPLGETTHILPKITEGEYFIRVFSEGQVRPEEGVSPSWTPCPRPFSSRDPLTKSNVDLMVGTWEGRVNRDQSINIELRQVTCGPGDLTTTLSGDLFVPTSVEGALYLHLNPTVDSNRSVPPDPLTFPLDLFESVETEGMRGDLLEIEGGREEGRSNDRRLSFTLSQLPQGSFEITVFTDDDGDARPTPCQLERGVGADLWRADGGEVTIERGDQVTLDRPITLKRGVQCDRLLNDGYEPLEPDEPLLEETPHQRDYIAVSGQLELTSALLDGLYLSDARVWFSYSRQIGAPHHFNRGKPLFSLAEAMLSRGRFTLLIPRDELLTNDETEPLDISDDLSTLDLTQHALDIAFWVERGGDGALIPCDDPIDPGPDLVWWEGDLSALDIFTLDQPLTPVPLTLLDRCPPAEGTLLGRALLPEQTLERWSTRSLILSLEDLFTGETRQSVIAEIDSAQESQRLYFERRIPRGSYAYTLFLDQDENRILSPCGPSQLGDLWVSPEGVVSIGASGVSPLLEVQLSSVNCIATQSIPYLALPLNLLRRVQPIEGCPENNVLIQVLHGEREVIEATCIAIEDGQLRLPSLPAGQYHLSVCLAVKSDPSSPTFERCREDAYLIGDLDFSMTQSPTQKIEPVLTSSCQCALSAP
jgi:hypothetical protein